MCSRTTPTGREDLEEFYALEYGEAAVEVHTDAIGAALMPPRRNCFSVSRVLIVDDLLWVAGYRGHPGRLRQPGREGRGPGGQVAGLAVLVELEDLRGRHRLSTATTSSPWYITPSDRQLASRAWDIRAVIPACPSKTIRARWATPMPGGGLRHNPESGGSPSRQGTS